MNKPLRILTTTITLACLASASTVRAEFPDKPIRAIVPFAAGSSNDTLARLVSPPMVKTLGHQIIILNMPGADGRIGLEALAKAAPDGYTILFSGGAIALVPALRRNVPYDPVKDIQPVAPLGGSPYVIGVSNALPARNLKEFVEYAKKNPGKLNAAAAGNSSFMAAILLQTLIDTKVEIISYKGTGPAALSIAAGETDFGTMEASSYASLIPSGKIRGLAVAATKRLSGLPDVPTTREAGLPEYVIGTNFGVYTKGGTPLPIVRTLNAAVIKSLATPEVSRSLRQNGMEPGDANVEEFTEDYHKEMARWKEVVIRAKLPLQD